MIEPRSVAQRAALSRLSAGKTQRDVAATLHCERGLTRLFGVGDIGRSGLSSGWAQPEDSHNWNDGPDAVIELSCDHGKDARRLIFQGEPYLPPTATVQHISLFANGYYAGYWRTRPHPHEDVSLVAEIDPEWWFERDGKPFLRLVLHIPGSMSPRDAGTGSDNRILGFCFRTVTLQSKLVRRAKR